MSLSHPYLRIRDHFYSRSFLFEIIFAKTPGPVQPTDSTLPVPPDFCQNARHPISDNAPDRPASGLPVPVHLTMSDFRLQAMRPSTPETAESDDARARWVACPLSVVGARRLEARWSMLESRRMVRHSPACPCVASLLPRASSPHGPRRTRGLPAYSAHFRGLPGASSGACALVHRATHVNTEP